MSGPGPSIGATELGTPRRGHTVPSAGAAGLVALSEAIVEVLAAAVACEAEIGEGCNRKFARLKRAGEAYRKRSVALGIDIPQARNGRNGTD